MDIMVVIYHFDLIQQMIEHENMKFLVDSKICDRTVFFTFHLKFAST